MSRFAGLRNAKVVGKGVYFTEGFQGQVKIVKLDMIPQRTPAGTFAFIAEVEVVKVDKSSKGPDGQDKDPVGAVRTWFQHMKDPDIALGAIKQFFAACLGVDLSDKSAAEEMDSTIEKDAEDAIAKDQPMKGVLLDLETYSKETKVAKKNFTVHLWRTPKGAAAAA